MRVRTPTDIGLAIRERRRQLALGQQDLATQVGVSRQWIVEIEKGKPRAEVGLLLRTLNALGLELDIDSAASAPGSGRGSSYDIDIDAIIERAKGRRR